MHDHKQDPRSYGDGYRAGYAQGINDGYLAAENAKGSATPAPAAEHAHWIKFDNGGNYSDRWQCSGCKRTARCESWGKKCEYERCPHCGAFMDGGAVHD